MKIVITKIEFITVEWSIAKWISLNLFEILYQPVQSNLTYVFSRLVCHNTFAANSTRKSVCVVADDTNMFILLLYVTVNCNEVLYFHQGTLSSRDSIAYHNITAHSNHLGEKICGILPGFHAWTGSDLMKVFYGKSKIDSFKILPSKIKKSRSNIIYEFLLCRYWENNSFYVTHSFDSRPINNYLPIKSPYLYK